MRIALLLLSALAWSCGATLAEPEGRTGDTDASAPVSPGSPDAGPQKTPDPAAPVDAAPDPAPDDATPVSPAEACTARYGAVSGFELCTATADACTFIAINGDTSCAAHCSAVGGQCTAAIDNKVGSCTELEPDPEADCATTGKVDLLCTCTP